MARKATRTNKKSTRKQRKTVSLKDAEEEKTSAAAKTKISRIITACARCRSRKVRCDKAVPRCLNCVKAGIQECICIDAMTGESISRSYIADLEDRLREAKEQLNGMKRTQLTGLFFNDCLLMESQEAEVNEEHNDVVPPRSFAEDCLQTYFNQLNVQLPIIHRDYYLNKYFTPIYGFVGSSLWTKILGYEVDDPHEKLEPAQVDENTRHRGFFFLYMIISILTSVNQNTLSVSDHYKRKAFKHVNSVWGPSKNENDDEITRLEMLQSLLLWSQYSMMRPGTPDAWYLIGISIRFCIELGLHIEPERVSMIGDLPFVTELKRRLFWSCYCLDKQASICYNRPFGIWDLQIDVKLPSLLDDLSLMPKSMKTITNIRGNPALKKNSLHFIKLRIIQSDILNFINDKQHQVRVSDQNEDGDVLESARLSDSPQTTNEKLTMYDEWKLSKQRLLDDWYNLVVDIDSIHVMNLNYHQTLLYIYRISPITPVIINKSHYMILYESSKQIISIYTALGHHSWAAIKDIPLAATDYLYLIQNCAELQHSISAEEIKSQCDLVLLLLASLRNDYPKQVQQAEQEVKSYTSKLLKLYELNKSKTSNLNNPIFSYPTAAVSQSPPSLMDSTCFPFIIQ